MGKKVFISHSSKDSKTATAICSALEARGHKCWMSSRDIKPGENFQGTIVRAIREAGVMVLVFSANANNSDEIKKEMALASQSKKMVIPVRAEDVMPSEDFTYELATRQWIDMFTDWEKSIEVLSDQVGAANPREDTGVRPAVAVESPVARKKNSPLFAVLALVLLAGGAAAYFLTRPAPAPATAAAPPAAVASVQPQAAAPGPASAAAGDTMLESQLWDAVKTSKDPAVVQSYLTKYPNGTFVAAAKSRLAALNEPAPAAVKAHASFSCDGVGGAQRIICSNPGLAAMDVELAALYK